MFSVHSLDLLCNCCSFPRIFNSRANGCATTRSRDYKYPITLFLCKESMHFFFLQTHGCIHTWTLLRFPLGSVRKDKILSNQKARCYHCQGKGVVSHSVCLTSALTVCGVQERECGWQGFHLPLPPPVAPCPSQLTVSVFTLDYMRKIVFSPSDSLSWLSYS